MSSNTVAEFANELKKSPETLLDQLKAAGVGKTAASDPLTESDKQKLLAYLQASHGTASADRKKITLVKKSTSEIKQADATGKARTIQVEVRKKRTFIQRDEGVEASAPAAQAREAAVEESAVSREDQELVRREEEARRQAELIRHQEAELATKRAEREERERREREAEERAAAYAAQEAAKKAQASAQQQEATREQHGKGDDPRGALGMGDHDPSSFDQLMALTKTPSGFLRTASGVRGVCRAIVRIAVQRLVSARLPSR